VQARRELKCWVRWVNTSGKFDDFLVALFKFMLHPNKTQINAKSHKSLESLTGAITTCHIPKTKILIEGSETYSNNALLFILDHFESHLSTTDVAVHVVPLLVEILIATRTRGLHIDEVNSAFYYTQGPQTKLTLNRIEKISTLHLLSNSTEMLKMCSQLHADFQGLTKNGSAANWKIFCAKGELFIRIISKFIIMDGDVTLNDVPNNIQQLSIDVSSYVSKSYASGDDSKSSGVGNAVCSRLIQTFLKPLVLSIYTQPSCFHHLSAYITAVFTEIERDAIQATLLPIQTSKKLSGEVIQPVTATQYGAVKDNVKLEMLGSILINVISAFERHLAATKSKRALSASRSRKSLVAESSLDVCKDY
jgi:hypothetical protein